MNAILCILSIALIAIPLADSAAYCTYHNYNANDRLTTVACSDGANGIMTKFKYTTLSPMYPYVTAFSGATWNSPKCGTCVRLTSGGRTVHLTVIDQCGRAPAGYDAHFDIAPPAFRELFGAGGVNAGVQKADWSFVDASNCRGNKGGSSKPAPKPAPAPGPKPTPATNTKPKPTPATNTKPKPASKSTTRCGANWADANGKCGTPCTTDAPCKGQRCYADLSMAPCNRAEGDVESTFLADSNIDVVTEFNDAAVADTFETTEGEYFADAAVADTVETTEGEYFPDPDVELAASDVNDAAVAGEISSENTQPTQNEASTGMQGWMVAILAMFSVTTVLLLAVVIIAIFVLRKH